MALNGTNTSIALLAPAVQAATSEIWRTYVTPIMPGMAGPSTTALVGICAAIVIAHLATSRGQA